MFGLFLHFAPPDRDAALWQPFIYVTDSRGQEPLDGVFTGIRVRSHYLLCYIEALKGKITRWVCLKNETNE
jgi:hypothetical protein